MVKTGFKPEWKVIHTKHAKEHEEKCMGKVQPLGFDY